MKYYILKKVVNAVISYLANFQWNVIFYRKLSMQFYFLDLIFFIDNDQWNDAIF